MARSPAAGRRRRTEPGRPAGAGPGQTIAASSSLEAKRKIRLVQVLEIRFLIFVT